MSIQHTRRDFVKLSALGFGTALFSFGLSSCDLELSEGIEFLHGVASGDPLNDRVIVWTRVSPQDERRLHERYRIAWELAIDPEFKQLVNAGYTETSAERDFTIKIDAAGLLPGQTYYYRFKSKDRVSSTGLTKTLADSSADLVRLAVVSCSNYPAGRFHVYREIAQRENLDAVVHLGDYIYEYARGEYASADAPALGREVIPAHELISLSDYRLRYAQYRSDPDLQAIHQNHPFISVWDDHEIANNSWMNGAENHQQDEGEFELRKLQALQAYSEWMPIRPQAPNDNLTIYRSFQFGNLVTLHMLDTRVIGRDHPLDFRSYFSPSGFDAQAFTADVNDLERSLLGKEQLGWLESQLWNQETVWQVLGQQVLMGRMLLPGALATQQISLTDFSRLLQLAGQDALGISLSADEQSFLDANRQLLLLPSLPYNLDAWDAFATERQKILEIAGKTNSNLIVLAGDTHNAWANNLVDDNGLACGVEFATASVSSPGLEEYLGLSSAEIPAAEAQLVGLIDQLQYANISDRGFLIVEFTADEAKAEFHFIDSVKGSSYRLLTDRQKNLLVPAGANRFS
ncbi:MAG: alkaline phosphatase D family protein [Oligoflexus sp.]